MRTVQGKEYEGGEVKEVELGHAEGTEPEDVHTREQRVSNVEISEFRNSKQPSKLKQPHSSTIYPNDIAFANILPIA